MSNFMSTEVTSAEYLVVE